MDEKLWRIVPVKPTDGDREVVDEVNEERCPYPLAVWRVAQARGCRTERVAGACNRVKLWVEFERRTASRRMLPDELREFRRLLGWEPLQGPWTAFANFMQDRIGNWCQLSGAYSRGLPAPEVREVCRQLLALIGELPPAWDPRQSRRFLPGFPAERKAVYLASPYYRWTA